MMWPFTRKPKVEDIVQAELARREVEQKNAARTEVLQRKLKDALSELGPKQKATGRD